jgi:hypothetical protein
MGFSAVPLGWLISRRLWKLVVLSGLCLLGLGELYMRLPFIPQRLEYQPDHELAVVLKPNQSGYVWLANLSTPSPPITLNADGHRGKPTDWSKPVLLALGDSEGLGVGVGDDEVYTAVLERLLRQLPACGDVQVVNASQPGFGPAQQLVVLRRILVDHEVAGLIVRVSIQDRNFRLPASAPELEQAVAGAERNCRVRQFTRFLPFLTAKLEAQLPNVRGALTPWFLRHEAEGTPDLPLEVGQQMWQRDRDCWAQMATLAEAHGLPLLFMVHDPLHNPATQALLDGVTQLAAEHRNCRVLCLDAAVFHLDAADPSERRQQLQARLTLWESHRDLHANALQHQYVAEAADALVKGERLFSNALVGFESSIANAFANR